jgi:formylglycine-generating enzyme required for sulfatase activity
MFDKFVRSTGYVTDAENNGVGFVWTFLGEQVATQFPGQTGVAYEWKLLSGVNWKNPPKDNQYSGKEVLQVSWNDAAAYCEWAGRELLTLKEWELARVSSLPITFYNSPDGLGEWGQDKTSGIYRAVLGRQDMKWGGYTTYVFQENGFIEYRSADRLTFRCKDR